MRFERFQVPPPEAEHVFNGIWDLVEVDVEPRGEWLERLIIRGSVWIGDAPDRRGFLKAHGDRGDVALLGCVLTLRLDGSELLLTSPTGKVLVYEYITGVTDAY
jgi:hypothetical protein